MKRNLLILLGIFLIIVTILTYSYYNYIKINQIANQSNKEFESYTNMEITGSTLMTLINKSINSNEKNEVEKDQNNRYIDNNENSIKIEIKFLESNNIFDMEAISVMGAEAFVKNYNSMIFICTQKTYHENTKKIKYMLFEQI